MFKNYTTAELEELTHVLFMAIMAQDRNGFVEVRGQKWTVDTALSLHGMALEELDKRYSAA